MKGATVGRAVLLGLAMLGCASAHALKIDPLEEATPEQVGISPKRLAALGNLFNKEVRSGYMRGAVLLIARRGKFVYQLAVGMQDATGRLYEDTLFRLYSMTVPLVTVGALKLVEDGKLRLADPVGRYLPEFGSMTVSVAWQAANGAVSYETLPAERPITVLDLLRQTSGMVYGESTDNQVVKDSYEQAGLYVKDVGYALGAMTAAEQTLRLANLPLAYPPGSTWSPGLSSEVLGRVIEAVSKKRLAEFMEDRVFGPLKMKDTAFWVQRRKQGRIAEPLEVDSATGRPYQTFDVTNEEPTIVSAGMGGISTAGDYLRFCQMLLGGGTLEEEKDTTRILRRETVQLMASDQLGAGILQPVPPGELMLGVPGYTYGLGLAVRKADTIAGVPGSAGELMWVGEAGSFFWVDPRRQLAVVMLTHAPRARGVELRKLVKQIVQQSLSD
ncbi:MAG: beta-lactamase family protein [Betaproteobacteria bacterium]|nr:beta-lactamase family protein [Betaproteobacteria bacterium]